MDISGITTVLIIGDEEAEGLPLQHSLESYGYQLFFSSKITKEVERSLHKYHPDVVLIQINPHAPNESLSLGRFLYKQGNFPFVYLSKPFDPINLHTSLQCALHCFKKHKASNTIMQQLHLDYDELKMKVFNLHSNSSTVNLCNCYQFKVKNFTLLYKNSEIRMTKKERSLMTLLIAQLGSIVHFDQIIRFVWGTEHQTHNDVRTLMWRLNKKLPIALVKNAMGIGYYIES